MKTTLRRNSRWCYKVRGGYVRVTFLSWVTALVSVLNATAFGAPQFMYGKYFGFIQMEGGASSIATALDAYVVQNAVAPPNEEFPALNVTLRTGLGGYLTAEYQTLTYETISYNFEKGILYLDDPLLDLTATLQVSNTEEAVILEGPVVYRPTLKHGRMRLEMVLDNRGPNRSVLPLLPTLAGEYPGRCGNRAAVLQIETGREASMDRVSKTGLSDYVVTGRLGYESDPLCMDMPIPCAVRFFSSADYRFFEGKLLLQGPRASMACTVNSETLTCTHTMLGQTEDCIFKKAPRQSTPPTNFSRRFYMKTTPEQKKPLPEPHPPGNEALADALTGDYYGFLHHENRDEYQLVRLNVVATSSSPNPHIPNRVYINASLSFVLGSTWESPSMFGQVFTRRVFSTAPNLALRAPNTDGFLVIDREGWRKEYLFGTWYSRGYGRVGTIEFIKGKIPEVPAQISTLVSIDGQFQGPTDREPEMNLYWLLKLIVPGQVPRVERNTVAVQGEYDNLKGLLSGGAFENGSFDMYTGMLSLTRVAEEPTLISGRVLSKDQLSLIWPVRPSLGVLMLDYGAHSYQRVGTP